MEPIQAVSALAVENGVPYPEHCYLDFAALEKKEVERKSKQLSKLAQSRAWLFEPCSRS